MRDDLSKVAAVLLVFAMPGCPACEDYLPRFERQVDGFARLGHPFVRYATGARITRGTIPIVIIDATSADPGVQALADQYGITGMPTTMFLTRNQGSTKHEGSLDDGEIYRMLVTATQVNR